MAVPMAASRVGLDAYSSYADQAQEQDANSALMELDIGLRSTKMGEQCEAIVRFPRLFKKYPFPILINSAFLKLAEVFRTGNNFLRLCILRVTQQSEKHLEKILSVDDLVKKIFSVMYSNDPVARALTLRTLGSIATIIPERKNAHHSIRNSLDSRDAVEVEGAIFAAKRFAAVSRTFATNICDKVAEMIQGLVTPAEMKLKLIPIFQHMHEDPITAASVRQICNKILALYPAQNFVLVTLHTLTKLSGSSYIDIAEQISLLLSHLTGDSRKAVKLLCLKDLCFLAKSGPHVWSEHSIGCLIDFCMKANDDAIQVASLKVLTTLAKSLAFDKLNIGADSTMKQLCCLCNSTCYSTNACIAAQSIELATAVVTRRENEELTHIICCAVESLLLVTISNGTPKNRSALKVLLKSVVDLSKAQETACSTLAESLAGALMQADEDVAVIVCEALAAVGSRNSGFLDGILVHVIDALKLVIAENSDHRLAIFLTCLVFQACREGIPTDALFVLQTTTQSVNCWDQFRIARQAARYIYS